MSKDPAFLFYASDFLTGVSDLTLDHIQPIHYGGENKIGNLQTLCRSCNSKKGTKFFDYR